VHKFDSNQCQVIGAKRRRLPAGRLRRNSEYTTTN